MNTEVTPRDRGTSETTEEASMSTTATAVDFEAVKALNGASLSVSMT